MNRDKKNNIIEIIDLHREIENHLRQSLMKVIRVGGLLDREEANFKKGEFGAWAATNFPFNVSRAREYIRLYRERERFKEKAIPEWSLKRAYEVLVEHREESLSSKVKQSILILNEAKTELANIQDLSELGTISNLTLESERVSSEMHLLTERQLEMVSMLTREGFFEKS